MITISNRNPPNPPKQKEQQRGGSSSSRRNEPIEEHIVLRVPISSPLHAQLKSSNPPSQVSLKFSSERNASFTYTTDDASSSSLQAILLDLPCIVESQKSFDNKLYHKIADISQILIVNDTSNPLPYAVDTNEHLHPHGITPPLKWVRKRRFRKRISKKAIEDVEREIERLLLADAESDDVKYEVHEQNNEGDNGTITAPASEIGAHDEEDWDQLANEIEDAIDKTSTPANTDGVNPRADDDDEEDDEEDGINASSSDDENAIEEEELEEEVDPMKSQELLLLEEIGDLEAKIEEKIGQMHAHVNPIMKKRFDDIVKRLEAELESKNGELKDVRVHLRVSELAGDEKKIAKEHDGEMDDDDEKEEGDGEEDDDRADLDNDDDELMEGMVVEIYMFVDDPLEEDADIQDPMLH